jgi:hypothetical protein
MTPVIPGAYTERYFSGTGGGKLFRDLTNPIQNLLWLVKIYHTHLAQFRDNTNFTISDLQNNTTTPNLTNN